MTVTAVCLCTSVVKILLLSLDILAWILNVVAGML